MENAPELAPLGSEARKRKRVRCSSLVDWPVYPRLRRTMQGSGWVRNAGRRGPQRGFAPASRPDHALLADGRARFFQHPRAAPPVRSLRRQKARPSEGYSGRAPQRARADQPRQQYRASINAASRLLLLPRSGHIFNRRLSAKNRLPKAPPPGHCSREALFYTAGPSLRRGDSLAQSRKHLRHPSIASRGGADRARWLRRVSAFRLPSAAGLVPQEGIPIVTQWAKWILLATAIL
jgi:hypothetical protein